MTSNVQQLPGTKRKASRRTHDWEEIERDYRAGVKSISQISREQDITRQAINRRAKQCGWERDLTNRVRRRAHEKLAREAARAFSPETMPGGPGERASEAQEGDQGIVELNAEAIVHVVRSHRRDLSRLRRTLSRLHAPLEQFLDGLEAWRVAEPAPEIPVRLAHVLGPRETLGDLTIKLTRALATLIPLERKAFGLDDRDPTAADFAEALDEHDRAILDDFRAAVARELKQEMAAD